MNIFSNIITKSLLIVLIPLLSFLLKEYIKATTKSNFDKIFMCKEQLRISLIISNGITALICSVSIITYGFLLEITGKIISFPSRGFIMIMKILVYITTFTSILVAAQYIVIIYQNIIKKTNRRDVLPKNSSLRKYLEMVTFFNFISLILITSVGLYSKIPNIVENFNELYFYKLITIILIYALFLYVLHYLYTEIIFEFFKLKYNYRTNYKMKVIDYLDIQEKNLFVLHALDDNVLVLGDAADEYKSDRLYLFDREKQNYLEFQKEEIRG